MSQHYKNVNALLWGIALLVAYAVLSAIANQAGTTITGMVLHALGSV